jgi:hypothetical protein
MNVVMVVQEVGQGERRKKFLVWGRFPLGGLANQGVSMDPAVLYLTLY